ncbi:MAG: hypothetical protein KDE27_09410 [Planctomycetes bacterium]|nr:hypothetical protein [Planctomycetota bacterium]
MPEATSARPEDFRRICFVIMPFGTKEVSIGKATRSVDFNQVYREIFAPAIAAVELPASEGGGTLIPKRADTDFHSGHIDLEMYELIEYSRFALADITGLNANVFYELGARHRAHESGTAIFRQVDAAIPFDINKIKALPYAIDPRAKAQESIDTIRRVLTESLARNAWDSPIMLALRKQREDMTVNLQQVLIDAENALRGGDKERAHQLWIRATELDPDNPITFIKASAYPKQKGRWELVSQLLLKALAAEKSYGTARTESSYGDAWRELGIAQNKLEGATFPASGREALERAVHYAPDDFDAWASLGGILRRVPDLTGALGAYEKAVEVSEGHPYPRLMALKLRARIDGRFEPDTDTVIALAEAAAYRTAQTESDPPMDSPWCFFDLAEVRLYQKKKDKAIELVEAGLLRSTASWMPGTFLSALALLPEGADIPGLDEVRRLARAREQVLKQQEEAEEAAKKAAGENAEGSGSE